MLYSLASPCVASTLCVFHLLSALRVLHAFHVLVLLLTLNIVMINGTIVWKHGSFYRGIEISGVVVQFINQNSKKWWPLSGIAQ